MMHLQFQTSTAEGPSILCMGAHSDDVEIGCGGTILRLARQFPACEINWVVFSATGEREKEARCGAQLFAGSHVRRLILKDFRDGFMTFEGSDVKSVFENELKPLSPDLIFTHYSSDAHQDHRLISELTWNTFRNHLIFEYEIPKYDGDLGRPNVFAPLHKEVCEEKVNHIIGTFQSQRVKRWFERETFYSLMRLRGMECVSSSGYAEAFYCRKVTL